MIKANGLFQESDLNLNKISRRLYSPKILNQIARKNVNLIRKELNKDLAEKMNFPYYFTNIILNTALIITLGSHQSNHRKSKIALKPNFSEVKKNIANKKLKEMAKVHAKLMNEFNFKYQVVFSARFDKQNQNDQVLDEVDFYIISKSIRKLTESNFDNVDVISQLEQQIQNQETRDSG